MSRDVLSALNLPAGSVPNAALASMAAGTSKGRQITAGSGAAVDLTGAEQGENLLLAFVQVITLAAGTYNNVEIDVRAKIVEFVPTGDVYISGFKLVLNPLAPGAGGTPGTAPPTGNVGGNFRVFKHGFSGRLVLLNYSGLSVAANAIGCPNTGAYALEQASSGTEIQYTGSYSKWQPVAKVGMQLRRNSAATLFTRDITNVIEGTGIALALADDSSILQNNLTVSVDQADPFTWTGIHSFGNALLLATVHSETTFTSGALNVTLNAFATRLYVIISGDGEIQSVAPAAGNPAAGRVIYCQIVGSGLKRIKHGSGASHPTLPGAQANLLCPNNRDLILGNRASFLLVGDGANGWLVSPISGGDITPWQLAPIDALTMAASFVIRTPFAAGVAGTPDDVTIYTAAPFAFAFHDVTALTATAIAASTVQIRNATAGGGVALSSALSTGAVGTARNNAGQTFTVAAGAPIYLRRGDRGVAGELIIQGYRT